jgi:hypothetical protein
MLQKTDDSDSYVSTISNSYRVISISSANPEIKNIIEPLGYSENKLLEGKKLYESIRNMQNTLNVIQRWRRSEEKRLIEAKNAAFQTIQDLQHTTKTPGSPDSSVVDMKGLTVAAFLSCAYAVLRITENASDAAPELFQSNRTADKRKLRKLERSRIITLDNVNQTVESANSSVNKASAELDEATAAFRSWFARYLTMITMALRGNKRLLDELGLDAKTHSCMSDIDKLASTGSASVAAD